MDQLLANDEVLQKQLKRRVEVYGLKPKTLEDIKKAWLLLIKLVKITLVEAYAARKRTFFWRADVARLATNAYSQWGLSANLKLWSTLTSAWSTASWLELSWQPFVPLQLSILLSSLCISSTTLPLPPLAHSASFVAKLLVLTVSASLFHSSPHPQIAFTACMFQTLLPRQTRRLAVSCAWSRYLSPPDRLFCVSDFARR